MLSDYQTLVTDLVRDDAGKVSTDQRNAAIASAVTRYSGDRPYTSVKDVVGSGALFDLPSGWEPDFSGIGSIEYPLGAVPPTFLDTDRYDLYQSPTAIKIMLLDDLGAASTIRVRFTIAHVVSAQADTVPVKHRELVGKYAAALLCDQLAAFYANESDSTIHADSVRQTSKSQAYAAKARGYRKDYLDGLGIQDKTAAPAGTVVQMKSKDSLGGPRFFHPARSLR